MAHTQGATGVAQSGVRRNLVVIISWTLVIIVEYVILAGTSHWFPFSSVGIADAPHLTHVVPNAPLSPTLASQRVYFPTNHGLYALRASDGTLRWTYPAHIDDPSIDDSIQGYVQDSDALYVLTRATYTETQPQRPTTLTELDSHDGSIRWSVAVPNIWICDLEQIGSLLIVIPQGPFTTDNGPKGRTITAYSAANGALVWSYTPDAIPYTDTTSPDGILYIATTQTLIALNGTNGAIRWTSSLPTQQSEEPSNVNVTIALTATATHIYALNKRGLFTMDKDNTVVTTALFYTIDAAIGRHLALSKKTYAGNMYFDEAYPSVIAGSTIYTPLFDGISASATGPGGAHWHFSRQGSSSPVAMSNGALAYGMIYVNTVTGVTVSLSDGALDWVDFTYAIRASDGAEMWRVPSRSIVGFDGAPWVAYGLVFVSSQEGLSALRASDGSQLWLYPYPGSAY